VLAVIVGVGKLGLVVFLVVVIAVGSSSRGVLGRGRIGGVLVEEVVGAGGVRTTRWRTGSGRRSRWVDLACFGEGVKNNQARAEAPPPPPWNSSRWWFNS
jgi:hypothetical protein